MTSEALEAYFPSNSLASLAFRCPITHLVFSDPVVASDGHTYEREAITRWLRSSTRSPITRERLTSTSVNLTPNMTLRTLMEAIATDLQ